MGLFSDVTDKLGITSKSQERQLEKGAQAQIAQSELAIEEQRAAREEARGLLQPFVDVGATQIDPIQQLAGQIPGAPGSLEGLARQNALGGAFGSAALLGGVSGLTGADTGALAQAGGLAGQVSTLGSGLGGEVSTLGSRLGGEVSTIGGLDPNVLQSPFFQALQDEATRNIEQSAASRGRVGAGGTREAIGRQSLLLGSQFAQQQQQAQLAAQGQRFGQASLAEQAGLAAQGQRFGQFGIAEQAGLTAQGQRFGQAREALGVDLTQQQLSLENVRRAQGDRFSQLQSSLGFGLGAQQQGFGQIAGARQQDFTNQLGVQQQAFGQRQSLLGLGQASAAGVGAQGLQSAGQVSDLLTGIGNVQAAERIGRANLASQTSENLIGVNAQNMELFGSLFGGGAFGGG